VSLLAVVGCLAAVDVASNARNEFWQVEGVGRTTGLLVCLQTTRRAFDEPCGTNRVATCLMSQAHAQLRQPLPQGTFLIGARLPPNLESFMGREWTPLVQQPVGVGQGLFRRKWFLRDGLNPH